MCHWLTAGWGVPGERKGGNDWTGLSQATRPLNGSVESRCSKLVMSPLGRISIFVLRPGTTIGRVHHSTDTLIDRTAAPNEEEQQKLCGEMNGWWGRGGSVSHLILWTRSVVVDVLWRTEHSEANRLKTGAQHWQPLTDYKSELT